MNLDKENLKPVLDVFTRQYGELTIELFKTEPENKLMIKEQIKAVSMVISGLQKLLTIDSNKTESVKKRVG